MKILRKIVLGDNIDKDGMNILRGGMQSRSNINDASGCICDGSTNSNFMCGDNENGALSCSCSGNGDNDNDASYCRCEGANDNSNGQTSCCCK